MPGQLFSEIFEALRPLEALFQGCSALLENDFVIKEVTNDSRDVTPDHAYVAIKGELVDGHAFIEEVLSQQVKLLIVSKEKKIEDHHLKNSCVIYVNDSRKALGILAALFYGSWNTNPLEVIGITGTNGKTTSAWMISAFSSILGTKTASIGTLGCLSPGHDGAVPSGLPESSLTTPDTLTLHKWCGSLAAEGFERAAIEISSHALAQSRADSMPFAAAVFTNLTRDHLDYHGTLEEYSDAKFKLFKLLAYSPVGPRAAVINIDCPTGRHFAKRLREFPKVKLYPFGFSEDASTRIIERNDRLGGQTLTFSSLGIGERSVFIPFSGAHNAMNFIGALLALIALGNDPELLLSRAGEIPQVPGRLQRFGNQKVSAYVDYAHTPDALENVIKTLKPLCKNQLWVVFGCGGDRDRGKRALMLTAASRADKVIITMDNPRTESPDQIIGDICEGNGRWELIEYDRKEAISYALSSASEGDIVLIAGKGHEDYQIVGTERLYFSDAKVVEEIFRTL